MGVCYTIETRLRFRGQEGKVIFQQADQNELWRLDLIASATARLTVGGRKIWGLPPAIQANVWYDVRVEVGDGVVSAFVNGLPTHENVPLGQIVPDGRIGVGSWEADAEFDYVRVSQGTQRESEYRRTNSVARLWAYLQVQFLEQQVAEYGPEEELLNHLMSLGFTYRLMDRTVSFFAPESGDQAGD